MHINNQDFGNVPIVIGITGHRNLRSEDVVPLQRTVRNTLTEIHQHCPHSKVVVLTSLGEGADRVCAEVSLDLGMEIHVLLPMPQEEYGVLHIKNYIVG